MITLLLLTAVVSLVLGLAANLPEFPLDSELFSGQAEQVGAMASALNGYAPVAQMGLALGVLVGLKLALLTWQVVVFIYHQFWGSN